MRKPLPKSSGAGCANRSSPGRAVKGAWRTSSNVVNALEVAVGRCGERLVDEMVARDVDRVDRIHPVGVLGACGPPPRQPRIDAVDQRANRLVVAAQHLGQRPERRREVGRCRLQQREEVVGEIRIVVGDRRQTELCRHAADPPRPEPLGKLLQERRRPLDGDVRVGVDEGQQRLGEPGEIPQRDLGLVAEGVSPAVVDRTEHRRRIVGIHERAGPVVDRLAGDGHVVGVHHPVDEPDEHPLRDEHGLRVEHGVQERERGYLGGGRCGRVTGDRVVEQPRQHRRIVERCGVLEGAHAKVAGGDTHEHGAGLHGLANDPVARRDDGETTSGRNPQRMHRFTHQVLAQHRTEHREPVAAASEGGAPRPLQVQVASRAVGGEHLAEQQRPAVTEPRGVPAELMAGVCLGDGLRPGGHRVADEHIDSLGRSQGVGRQPEFDGEGVVQHDQVGFRGPSRRPFLVQAVEVADERVVEGEIDRRVHVDEPNVPAGHPHRSAHPLASWWIMNVTRPALAIAISASLVVAACGGSGGEGEGDDVENAAIPTAPSDETVETPPPTDPPVVVVPADWLPSIPVPEIEGMLLTGAAVRGEGAEARYDLRYDGDVPDPQPVYDEYEALVLAEGWVVADDSNPLIGAYTLDGRRMDLVASGDGASTRLTVAVAGA